MKQLILLLLLGAYCHQVKGQISIGAKLSGGYSLAGSQNLMTTKALGGASLFANWKYAPKLLGYTEVSTSFFQNENPFLQWKRMDFFALGIGKDVLKEKNKFQIFISPLIARFTLKPQTNNDLKLSTSHWTQWGVKLDGVYFFHKNIGVSLGYTYCFAHIYDTPNFQSLLNCSVVFRWMKSEKMGTEEK